MFLLLLFYLKSIDNKNLLSSFDIAPLITWYLFFFFFKTHLNGCPPKFQHTKECRIPLVTGLNSMPNKRRKKILRYLSFLISSHILG